MRRRSVSASQTIFLRHQKCLSDINVIKKKKKKIFFLIGSEKPWDFLIKDEINKTYIKQQNHHSIFDFYERKGGKWIIQRSGSYGLYLFLVPLSLSWADGRERSIPLRSRMQCTKDACTVVQFYLFLIVIFIPYLRPIV